MSDEKNKELEEPTLASDSDNSGNGEETSAREASASGKSVESDVYKEKAEQLQREYLYLRAEFDNYRKQAIKERSQLQKYAGERLAHDMLNVLDVLEQALRFEVTPDNLEDFKKGFELTAAEFIKTLNKHGIEALPTDGAAFDPSIHEAMGSEPSSAMPPGHILRTFRKPYKFHDRILRPGQVIVAMAPKDNGADKEPTVHDLGDDSSEDPTSSS